MKKEKTTADAWLQEAERALEAAEESARKAHGAFQKARDTGAPEQAVERARLRAATAFKARVESSAAAIAAAELAEAAKEFKIKARAVIMAAQEAAAAGEEASAAGALTAGRAARRTARASLQVLSTAQAGKTQ